MEKKPELSFRPLSSGLGFHPFADGLPYAPVAKTQTGTVPPQARPASTAPFRPALPTTPPSDPSKAPPPAPKFGTGAVAAGRPTFVPPQRPLTVSVALQTVKEETARIEAERAAAKPLLQAGAQFGYGYAFKRVLAFLLDSSINLGLCSLALLASLWKQGLNLELLVNPGVALLVLLFMTAFNWAVITAQEVAFGTSIGKRVFKLALDGPISVIFLRSILFLLSLGLGGLGIVWALFDRKKRCWHDVVVDVQPIELARL